MTGQSCLIGRRGGRLIKGQPIIKRLMYPTRKKFLEYLFKKLQGEAKHRSSLWNTKSNRFR